MILVEAVNPISHDTNAWSKATAFPVSHCIAENSHLSYLQKSFKNPSTFQPSLYIRKLHMEAKSTFNDVIALGHSCSRHNRKLRCQVSMINGRIQLSPNCEKRMEIHIRFQCLRCRSFGILGLGRQSRHHCALRNGFSKINRKDASTNPLVKSSRFWQSCNYMSALGTIYRFRRP